ncbi:MAG TPA: N-methyl-L-tryptophan oxidase [Candidatus Tumulicola sp.]|nr:N-methyl-L-tryptophan oxidase [Candidatus Tumulicola sp.]
MARIRPVQYDAAVVGLGGMGAAALAHLARRGVRAVGIDRFARDHALGASSGETRVIRMAYFEDPAYVPLLQRAYALWAQLEEQTGQTLLDLTGILLTGERERDAIAGTLRAAREYGLPLELLDADELRRRFPGATPRASEIGLLERRGGIVFPEAGVRAHLRAAQDAGAELRFETTVRWWEAGRRAIALRLNDDTAIETARLILAPGMWSDELLGDLGLPLRVQRNVQVWFEPATRAFDRGTFPAFLVDRADLPAALYGFPAIGGALKAALHAYGEAASATTLDRDVHDADVAAVRTALEPWMPGASDRYLRAKVCPYTLTPDANFVLGPHPRVAGVVIACGFSGHGYKFCPVVGEIAADLALDGATRFEIGFMSPTRFA